MTDRTASPADAIEQDIRRTQDQMGATIEKLEDRLSPPQIARSMLGEGNGDVLNDAIEITRKNPIPVALIAIGIIWLLADSRTGAAKKLSKALSPSDIDHAAPHNPITTAAASAAESSLVPGPVIETDVALR